jgi:osmotically-inducible protein OsmY
MTAREMDMEKRGQLFLCAIAFVMTAVLSGCVTERRCSDGGCAGDDRITADVQVLLGQHLDLAPPGAVRVHTIDHVVYLDGAVSEGLQRETIGDIARGASGVSKVVNAIAVVH